jgi:iron complex outermembrane receptor protein
VREAQTDVTSFALVNAGGVLQPVTRSQPKYRDFLPALNVSATLPHDVYAALLGRQDPVAAGVHRPGAVHDAQHADQTVSIGNPTWRRSAPRPTTCRPSGITPRTRMISVGYFHKDIGTFIQGVSSARCSRRWACRIRS